MLLHTSIGQVLLSPRGHLGRSEGVRVRRYELVQVDVVVEELFGPVGRLMLLDDSVVVADGLDLCHKLFKQPFRLGGRERRRFRRVHRVGVLVEGNPAGVGGGHAAAADREEVRRQERQRGARGSPRQHVLSHGRVERHRLALGSDEGLGERQYTRTSLRSSRWWWLAAAIVACARADVGQHVLRERLRGRGRRLGVDLAARSRHGKDTELAALVVAGRPEKRRAAGRAIQRHRTGRVRRGARRGGCRGGGRGRRSGDRTWL